MSGMFGVDGSEMKEFERILGTVSRASVPIAVQRTLNNAAFKTRLLAQDNIRSQMVTRNKFTERSVRVEKAKGLRVERMEAAVGSIADYMADQEFGTVKRSTGRHGIRIPTSYASNEGESSIPKRRLPVGKKKFSKIRLNRRALNAVSKRQEIFLTAKFAIQSGKKFVFFDNGEKKAIYHVTGRVDRRGHVRRLRMKMIWDMSEKTITVDRNPWLLPATDDVIAKLPDLYREEISKQLDRFGLR